MSKDFQKSRNKAPFPGVSARSVPSTGSRQGQSLEVSVSWKARRPMCLEQSGGTWRRNRFPGGLAGSGDKFGFNSERNGLPLEQWCAGKLSLKKRYPFFFFLVQFSSVAQSCPTLCDPMNRSTPGLPVHHQLPEFTQTHVHQVGDAIQPSHPLSSPSPPAPNPSQHQGLLQ